GPWFVRRRVTRPPLVEVGAVYFALLPASEMPSARVAGETVAVVEPLLFLLLPQPAARSMAAASVAAQRYVERALGSCTLWFLLVDEVRLMAGGGPDCLAPSSRRWARAVYPPPPWTFWSHATTCTGSASPTRPRPSRDRGRCCWRWMPSG